MKLNNYQSKVIDLEKLDRQGIAWAQKTVTDHHYLHHPVDSRCSVEGWGLNLNFRSTRIGPLGVLLFGRPEATRCADWYGSVEDVKSGRCEVTRWQVLNLARVWLHPDLQPGGDLYDPTLIPGFTDRRGIFRSTLASAVLKEMISRIGYEYLISQPPCFLDEPYEIKWLLSYCDTRLHKGTIYKAAGFELYRTNDRGIQTWRIRLPALTWEQDELVRNASWANPRSNRYRAQRAQLELGI